MFSTDGNTTFTILCVAAALLAASVASFLPSFTTNRKPAIVANAVGALLVTLATTLVLYFWDWDISWLARICIMLCAVSGFMILANSAALYMDRGDRMRKRALEKAGIDVNS